MPPPPSSSFLDDPKDLVADALLGLCSESANDVKLLPGFPDVKVVVGNHAILSNSDASSSAKTAVALISGGGSGHEPFACGYVGRGMLSAAVCGDVFASPSAEAVYRAIKAVTSPSGCLLIVLNYTGDRLNFGIAAERAKAEGLRVEMVVVGDDVAIPGRPVARRGIAGSVLVHKLAGAAAADLKSLDEVAEIARTASECIATLGVSLSVCNVPGQAEAASDRIGPGEMEVGLGIHGEPGREKRPVGPARTIVESTLRAVARENDYATSPEGAPVVLLINNLGATTPLELSLLAFRALEHATSDLKLDVQRLFVGPLVTSLDMAGFSCTLLNFSAWKSRDAFLALLDRPTEAPAWPACSRWRVPTARFLDEPAGESTSPAATSLPDDVAEGAERQGQGQGQGQAASHAIARACRALLAAAAHLDALDRSIGDGDCGATMAKAATKVLEALPALPLGSPRALASALGRITAVHMGGTSGAIYTIFFHAASAALGGEVGGGEGGEGGENFPDLMLAAVAGFRAGLAAIQKYSGAQPGDRTLVDVFAAVLRAWDEAGEGKGYGERLGMAKAAAAAAVHATEAMPANVGRASYVPPERLAGNPDPGAYAANVWLAEVIDVMLEG